MSTFALNNGISIPSIGFGTWQIKRDKNAKAAVPSALDAGYRLIDTAAIYGNERGVGEAIHESGIPRSELFITTKVWNNDQGYDRTLKACKTSLEKLGLDYLDLYLIHWPATSRREDSWRALEKLVNDGLVRSAGVSNYTIEHLQALQAESNFKPAVNQVEFHPFIYDDQRPLLEYCASQQILIEAYSPISRISRKGHDVLSDIAEKIGRTPQQVALRWCHQHGTLPLPRSTNPEHIRSNLSIFDFELSDEEMQQLNSVSDGGRVTWDPAGMGSRS